ncbi:hypothetical protein D3C72_2125120 [compost metagenome]
MRQFRQPVDRKMELFVVPKRIGVSPGIKRRINLLLQRSKGFHILERNMFGGLLGSQALKRQANKRDLF